MANKTPEQCNSTTTQDGTEYTCTLQLGHEDAHANTEAEVVWSN